MHVAVQAANYTCRLQMLMHIIDCLWSVAVQLAYYIRHLSKTHTKLLGLACGLYLSTMLS